MNPVIETIFSWLRPYQLAILTDDSRYQAVLKSRQVGISDTIALKMVLISSGLIDLLEQVDIVSHNCVIISKRDTDAKDVISKAKEWVRRLRLVAEFEPYLRTAAYSTTQIKFVESGYRIISETQNEDAGRGKTGHLWMDEFAFYQWQREIFLSAAASTESRPDLGITIVSTPNGQGDKFHEVWTDEKAFGDWSRHRIDIYQARDQGMPVDVDTMRSKYTADGWSQEFECSFLGGEVRYFDLETLANAEDIREPSDFARVLGIDAASVVDNTSVQVIDTDVAASWLGDNYTLSRLAYQGTPGRLGQVDIVEALVRELRPSIVVIDQTGDNANSFTRDAGGLYRQLKPRLRGLCRLVPVTISRSWKNTHVERLKTGMTTKRVRFDVRRRDLVFSNRALNIDPVDSVRIVNTGFEVSPFPILLSDFAKVHRKWTGEHKTTFDTTRAKDGSGHGDSFWAACIGYSGAGMGTQGSDLDRKLRAIMTSEEGGDYGDYF